MTAHNSREAFYLAFFEQAGAAGMTRHELKRAADVRDETAGRQITVLQARGLLVAGRHRGSKPTRFWLAKYEALAAKDRAEAPEPKPAKVARDFAPVAEVWAAIVEAGRAGISQRALAERFDVSGSCIYKRLAELGDKVEKRRVMRTAREWDRVCFSAEFLPATPPVVKPTTTIRAMNLRLPQDQPAIITEKTKFTACPAFEDMRVKFVPTPGWVGQITRDQRESRLAAMS